MDKIIQSKGRDPLDSLFLFGKRSSDMYSTGDTLDSHKQDESKRKEKNILNNIK